MYPNYSPINEDNFKSHDCTAFYGDVKNSIPVNASAPRDKEVLIRMMVDSDHAVNEADRRSRMGYMIYVQMALIDCLYKN